MIIKIQTLVILEICLKKEKILKFLILHYIIFSKMKILNLRNLIGARKNIDAKKEKNVKVC